MEFTKEQILASYKVYYLLRANKGMSDSAVAREADVCRSTLSAWRVGRTMPSLPSLLKVANYFNISVTDFFAA